MANKKRWGVGIVGARGWGGLAHIPAINGSEAFEVRALTGTRPESAREAAERFGIGASFTDVEEMVEAPGIDVVAVTVRVPEHDRIVRTAIRAGKCVVCEWPLARNTAEAEHLLALAGKQRNLHVVGLQARANPAVRRIREWVDEGVIGRVLAVHASATLPDFPTRGGTVDEGHVYLLDEANGTDQLTIGAAHMLDAIGYMVAPLVEVSAILGTQYKDVLVTGSGTIRKASAPDHAAIAGRLAQDAILAAQVVNGGAPGFSLRLIGSEGELVVTPRDGLMFQMDRLSVRLVRSSGEEEMLDRFASSGSSGQQTFPPGPQHNVAHLYDLLAKKLAGEPADLPDFMHGLRVHRMLDAIRKAANTGMRQPIV